MELLIIAAVAVVLWFAVAGSYKTKLQDPQTLRPAEIEDSIIELKKSILITSAYTAEKEYERLYRRLKSLMGQILERHQHFVLDVEAKGSPPFGLFRAGKHHDSDGMQYTTYSIPHNLDPSGYSSDLLIYACFFLWQGGQAKNVGPVDSDPELMMRILDSLIDQKDFGPAIFLKGMVRKYGLKVYSQCYPSEAKQLLERAQQAGVGSAAIELANIAKYSQLADIKSIQLGE